MLIYSCVKNTLLAFLIYVGWVDKEQTGQTDKYLDNLELVEEVKENFVKAYNNSVLTKTCDKLDIRAKHIQDILQKSEKEYKQTNLKIVRLIKEAKSKALQVMIIKAYGYHQSHPLPKDIENMIYEFSNSYAIQRCILCQNLPLTHFLLYTNQGVGVFSTQKDNSDIDTRYAINMNMITKGSKSRHQRTYEDKYSPFSLQTIFSDYHKLYCRRYHLIEVNKAEGEYEIHLEQQGILIYKRDEQALYFYKIKNKERLNKPEIEKVFKLGIPKRLSNNKKFIKHIAIFRRNGSPLLYPYDKLATIVFESPLRSVKKALYRA